MRAWMLAAIRENQLCSLDSRWVGVDMAAHIYYTTTPCFRGSDGRQLGQTFCLILIIE